uniref:Uncharacterized protein LOC104214200 n=1 Tax=Nicotiana sylvestris TaxID=4096 RepID=A0A1U7VJX4_NICSY|nr:PREDICTED: uncharacterized protein LOC104214200 [Nicotiana sylvestris]
MSLYPRSPYVSLQSPTLSRGLIKLARWSSRAMFLRINESWDQGRMGWFVRIRTLDLIFAEDMPFPKKWNMKPMARILVIVPELKEWVEGLVSQRLYSEHTWMELSKGRWEASNHDKLLFPRLRCCIMRLYSESRRSTRLRFRNSPRRGVLTSF